MFTKAPGQDSLQPIVSNLGMRMHVAEELTTRPSRQSKGASRLFFS